jgi:DNA-binding NarL/FixJ family response regulator
LTKKIIMADDDGLFRAALRVSLDNEPGLRVLAEVSDTDSLISACARGGADMVLLSADLPGGSTVASTCRRLLLAQPDLAVLALTESDDEGLLLQLLDAGAIGYVTRNSRLSDLVHSVHAALRGEACIPRGMLGGLLKELISRRRKADAGSTRINKLSHREKQVLRELTEGRDGEEIAARLFISPQTVRTHIQNVMAKLEVHSRVEAANLARELGLLDDERGADSA